MKPWHLDVTSWQPFKSTYFAIYQLIYPPTHLPIPPIHLTSPSKNIFRKRNLLPHISLNNKKTPWLPVTHHQAPLFVPPIIHLFFRPRPSMLHWARGRQQDVWTYFLDVHNVNLHLGLSPPPWIFTKEARRLKGWAVWNREFFDDFFCSKRSGFLVSFSLSPKTRKKKQVAKGRVDSCLGGIKAKQVGTNSISKSACCRLEVQTFYIIWSVPFDGRLHQLVIFHVHFLSSWQREKKSWNK